MGEQHRIKAMSGTKIIIRPWSDFLSTSDVSVPKRADVLSERIRLNLNHWLGNYLCIVAAFVVLAGYFYPGLLLAVRPPSSLRTCVLKSAAWPSTSCTSMPSLL